MHNNKKILFNSKWFRILIEVFSGCVWILALFAFDDVLTAITSLFAIFVHEAGHETALLLLGKKARLPVFRTVGLTIKPSQALSYKDELTVLFFGPLANIAVAFAVLPLSYFHSFFLLFSTVNLITAFSNLIPIKNQDGYKIILNLIEEHFPQSRLRIFLSGVSFFLAMVLVFVSLYIIYNLNGGYWIFGIFFFFLLTEIKNDINR